MDIIHKLENSRWHAEELDAARLAVSTALVPAALDVIAKYTALIAGHAPNGRWHPSTAMDMDEATQFQEFVSDWQSLTPFLAVPVSLPASATLLEMMMGLLDALYAANAASGGLLRLPHRDVPPIAPMED